MVPIPVLVVLHQSIRSSCISLGAADFVDSLFAALRSKSYVPYTSPSSAVSPVDTRTQDAGIPIPLDALISSSTPKSPERGLKRSLEDDERETRGPPKGPRLGNESHFARYPATNGSGPQDNGNWQRGSMDGRRDDAGVNGRGRPRYQPPGGVREMLPRGVCRDYHSAFIIVSCRGIYKLLIILLSERLLFSWNNVQVQSR